MRQKRRTWIGALMIGALVLAVPEWLPNGSVWAAGVDPSELAAGEKIPAVPAEPEDDSNDENDESIEAAAEGGREGLTEPGDSAEKKWPTPHPQKMVVGRDAEVRKQLSDKNWAEAAVTLRSILDEKPQSIETAFNLSRALTYLGRREEGLQLLAQLASTSQGKKRTMIVRRLRVLSELFKTNESYQLYQEGVNLMSAGREKSAQERFSQVQVKEPGNIAVMLRLGQCLVVAEEYSGAVEQLRVAAKLNPYMPEVRLWLGRALSKLNEGEESLAVLESVNRELPGSELAPRWYAEALLLAGKREKALEALKADVERNPLHLLSLLAMANIRYAGLPGQIEPNWDVKKDLQVAISRLPDYHELRSRGPRASLEYLPYPLDSIRKDIDTLLSQVESRIKSEAQ